MGNLAFKLPTVAVCLLLAGCAAQNITGVKGGPTFRPGQRSPQYYRSIARRGINDLIRNYWAPDANGGAILPTWTGLPLPHLPDKRGAIWERGMMLFALDNYYQVTGNHQILTMIRSECARMMRLYQPRELETPGSLLNTAVDDCGWNAAVYLLFYRRTGEKWMLDRATNLVNNVYRKWLDNTFGGGLWYRDEPDPSKRIKSLYSVAIVMDSLDIWKLTGDHTFYDRAVSVYEWMQTHLARPDGIYFCDYNANGPVGADRPDDIHEAGSVSFLAGNMAMAVIHARLYRITKDKKYLQRAIRTAQGILDKEVKNGIYLNDRDAWTDATFMGQFVREVLPLPGVNQRHREVLRRTAQSIMRNDRTNDGRYGGCWGGPADGPGSKWSAAGSTPQQIMTSANTVNVLVSAAALKPRRR